MYIEEIFQGTGVLENVGGVCICGCYCTASDPAKDDASEDAVREEK